MDVRTEVSIGQAKGDCTGLVLNRESPWGAWVDCDGLMPPPFGGPQPSYIVNSYEDDVWVGRIINPAIGRPTKINFKVIPAPFLWYAKWFVWGLEFIPAHLTRGGAIKSSRSAVQAISNIGHFLRYVHAAGHKRLDAVRPETILAAARDFMQRKKTVLDNANDIDSEAANVEGKVIFKRRQTIEAYLADLDRMFAIGPSGLGFIPDGLVADSKDAAVEILSVAPCNAKTLAIPEPIAHKLLNEAIVWIETKVDLILRLQQTNSKLRAAFKAHCQTVPTNSNDQWERFAPKWVSGHPTALEPV